MRSDREWLEKLYHRFGWAWWRCRQHRAFTIHKPNDEEVCVGVSKVESFARAALKSAGREAEYAPGGRWPGVEHGKTCPKLIHGSTGGYLHGSNDDRPYTVDGVDYCGRCHVALYMGKEAS